MSVVVDAVSFSSLDSNYALKRHLSMIAVPKVLKCYDCDTTLSRNEVRCGCAPGGQFEGIPSSAKRGQQQMREAYCHNRLMTSHTALEYW